MSVVNQLMRIKSTTRTQFLNFSQLSNLTMIFLSLDFCIIDFNELAAKFFRWDRDLVLGKSYLEWCKKNNIIAPVDARDRIRLLNGLPILDIETDLYNGKHILSWRIVGNLNEEDEPSGIILIGKEITHDKTNELSLKAQIEKLSNISKIKTGYDIGANRPANDYISNVSTYLENIISGMPCWVYWKNSDFVYLGCNDLAARSLKIPSKASIVGMTDYDFGWGKEKVDAFRKVDEEIVRTGKPQLNLEETVLTNGGTIIYLLVNKMPIFDENKRVIGIVGISVDITEQKRVESEIIFAKEAAETANRLKSEFILNMEHDIRTPFAGILGMTKMLDQFESEPFKKEIIADIHKCTQELLDYSCSILDFSNVEGGQLPILLKKIRYEHFIQSIIAIESLAAKMKKLDFKIECDKNMPKIIIGDGYRLKRILINLLSNAIKFTDKGFIRLVVKVLKTTEKNVILRFIVEDSGIGIEEEKLNFIYEKFSRLTPSSQGIYKGTGLGLRIVKQFTEDMEGDVEIKSTPGQGSSFICTFSFKLPVFGEE